MGYCGRREEGEGGAKKGECERDLKPGIGLLLIACLLELDWLIQLVEYKFFFFPFTYGYYFDIR